MDITWLGHACFRVRGSEAVLLSDPFSPELGLTLAAQDADVVTVSNQHPYHGWLDALQGSPRVLSGPGEYEVRGLYVKGVHTVLKAEEEGQDTWNTIFLIEMDGLVLCHMGDLAEPLSSRQVEELATPDVLLVPVGGGCTITPAQAAQVVNRLAPKVVVPMHYSLPGLRLDLEPVETFLREMGLKETQPQSRLSVTRSTLPAETTVVMLQPPSPA